MLKSRDHMAGMQRAIALDGASAEHNKSDDACTVVTIIPEHGTRLGGQRWFHGGSGVLSIGCPQSFSASFLISAPEDSGWKTVLFIYC